MCFFCGGGGGGGRGIGEGNVCVCGSLDCLGSKQENEEMPHTKASLLIATPAFFLKAGYLVAI